MLNNTGDKIPPCVTPLPTWNEEDNVLPHLTFISCFVYQNINNLTTNKGTFLSINLVNNNQ